MVQVGVAEGGSGCGQGLSPLKFLTTLRAGSCVLPSHQACACRPARPPPGWPVGARAILRRRLWPGLCVCLGGGGGGYSTLLCVSESLVPIWGASGRPASSPLGSSPDAPVGVPARERGLAFPGRGRVDTEEERRLLWSLWFLTFGVSARWGWGGGIRGGQPLPSALGGGEAPWDRWHQTT